MVEQYGLQSMPATTHASLVRCVIFVAFNFFIGSAAAPSALVPA
jgi:hypothetical protein